MPKGRGRGWHKEPKRHSDAAKKGHKNSPRQKLGRKIRARNEASGRKMWKDHNKIAKRKDLSSKQKRERHDKVQDRYRKETHRKPPHKPYWE